MLKISGGGNNLIMKEGVLMRGLMKRRQGFISALVISIFVGFVGLAYANTASTKSVPENTDHAAKAQVDKNYGKLPLSFIRNDGQMDEKVEYYERGSGHSMYFTGEGVYLELISSRESEASTSQSPNQVVQSARPDDLVGRKTIKLSPIGANKNPKIIADGMQKGKVNYLIGNDPEKWKTNIPTYQSVVYKDIYENIDMKFYGNNRQMEYDVIVKPGADVSVVQISYEGTEGLNITEDGRMEIALNEGKVIQNKPYCYQDIDGKRVEVEGSFKLIESSIVNRKSQIPNQKFSYAFDVASYNKDYSLVIDPTLIYSTFLGAGFDYTYNSRVTGIAADNSGNVYLIGRTSVAGFPATVGKSFDGSSEAYVTKLDPTGTYLVYSTFLGGSCDSTGASSIVVDSNGNAYIAGSTKCNNFPTTSGAYDTVLNNDDTTTYEDAFVAKLDSTGSNLLYSTYIGGIYTDRSSGIVLDSAGDVYVTGTTSDLSVNSGFPITPGTYSSEGNSNANIFISKFQLSGTGSSDLLFSTSIGGDNSSSAAAIEVDNLGNIYVVGGTSATDFPTTDGAYDTLINNDGTYASNQYDGFLLKLSPGASGLLYSTYIGGAGLDRIAPNCIALDSSGNVFIAGDTKSSDFPTTIGAYDDTYNGDGVRTDIFLAVLTPSGSGNTDLLYSTYFGGNNSETAQGIISDFDHAVGIALDSSGNVYIAGTIQATQSGGTYISDFPTTTDAFQSYNGGGQDGFISILTLSGSGSSDLIYSSYLGGTDSDGIDAFAMDDSGNIYVAGYTYSNDFPITPGAYVTDFDVIGLDIFVSSFSIQLNTPLDADGDGFLSIADGGADCEDRPNGADWIAGTADDGANIYPGAFEPGVCGGIDNNCDGQVFQGSAEVCDGIDNNCNGDIDELTITKMEAAMHSSFAVSSNGTLWAWGKNDYGQLGDGTTNDRSLPVQVGSENDWVSVAGGRIHALGLKSDGTLWAWGYNGNGALGDGTWIDSHTPVQTGSDNNWVSIAAGQYHSLGLKSNGTLWAWGYAGDGGLGDGTSANKSNPVQISSGSTWASVAAGLFDHSMGIKTDGTLWAWGWVQGGLGDGTTLRRYSPVQVGSSSDWAMVSGGGAHSTGLKTDGTLWAWGSNNYGQLGNGSTANELLPVQIGIDWVAVDAGDNYTLGLKSDGTLLAWGANTAGQLGIGSTDYNPHPIPEQIGSDGNWNSVSAGAIHSFGLKLDGTSWAWGSNNNGRSGNGRTYYSPFQTASNVADGTLSSTYYQDADGDGYGDPTVSQVSCVQPAGYVADDTDCNDGNSAINSGATEVCDGVDNNCNGQADEGLLNTHYQDSDGDGYGNPLVVVVDCTPPAGYVTDSSDCNDADSSISPGVVEIPYDGIDQDCSGADLTDVDGDGYDSTVVAGGTDCNDADAGINPGAIEIFDGVDNNCNGQTDEGFIDADLDGYASVATGGYDCNDTDASINPGATEICDGIDNTCNGLIDIEVASYSKIESGQFHYLGLKFDGTLWAWGANNFGQLGDGTTTDRWSSVQIGSDSDWVAITAGENHSLGLKSNGTLWAWGRNIYAQLGDGTTTNRLSPVQVGNDNDWVSIAAGQYHSHGLKSNGTLWAWGYNWNGQLGDGTTYQRYAPVQVGSDSNWAFVTTYLHTLGLKTDGTLWAWGRNNYGQLGDGSTYEKSSPVQVGSGSDWILVSLGRNHSIALKNDGTLWAWGINTYGQLGDGTTSQTYSPVQAGSDSDWSSVAAKDDHTLALKTDGTLWAWGRNDYGQLGDGSTYGKSSPAQIGSDDNWESIAIGQYHSLGLKTDGALWAWGNNTYGQLGDGTTTNRTTPGTISGSLLTTYYQDADGDGYGDSAVSQDYCLGSQPADYVTDNSDCNDIDINEHPGQVWYKDADNDLYSDGTTLIQCARPLNYKLASELTVTSGDCDDSNAAVNPGVAEVLNNGIDDDCDPLTTDADTDNDGVADSSDQCPGFDDSLDVDADGIPDGCDAFPSDATETTDTDGDGTGDNTDTDDDNDGVIDTSDAFPLDATETTDTDSDGTGNNADTDDDNDGYSDAVETTEGTDPLSAASKPADNDGDFDPDSTDPDDDNDGVIDTSDAFPLDATETTDSDGDGIGDNTDTCPNDAGNDADGDLVCGDVDNCPLTSNADQLDSDGDGVGDACDVFIADPNESSDNDGDGVGDNADADFTDAGTAVVVEPVDTNPDATTTTTLTFDNVEEAGTTTVTSEEIVLFPPPSGFMLSSIMSYDVVSTADFTGSVSFCITYADAGRDGGDDSIEDTYKLFHYEDGQWVDITTFLDTVNNQICGLTTSFSPFAVFVDTEVLSPLIEGAMTGGGQSSEVDGFLRYTSPSAKSISLPVDTTDFDIGIVYGDIDAGTFQATLNGVPFAGFDPVTVTTYTVTSWETVSIPLDPGRNVLVLKVKGTKASGRLATDTDRLVFVVK